MRRRYSALSYPSTSQNRGFNEHVQDPCDLNSQHSQRGCFVYTWTKFGNFWKSGAIVQKAEVRYCNFAFFYIFCFYFVFRIIINVEKNTERSYLGNFFTVALSFHVSVSTSHQLLACFSNGKVNVPSKYGRNFILGKIPVRLQTFCMNFF